jgi:hypothetical protein
MRSFTDRPEVTEVLAVTVSDELGISRSLVYRLVVKFGTAAKDSRKRCADIGALH